MLEALKYLLSLLYIVPETKETRAGVEYLVTPDNSRFTDMDKYRERPRRLEETVEFFTLESLIAYIIKWQTVHSVMMCGINNKNQMKAILDFHEAHNLPSWKGHRALLTAEVTPEWTTWEAGMKARMSQREFVNFLEDNAMDINPQKTPLAPLITQIRDVQVNRAGATRAQSSSTRESVDHSAAVEVATGLPEIIELVLKPWQHSARYEVRARPFIHLNPGEAPKFSYQLINLNKVREQAYNAAVKEVADATGIATYK